MTIELNGIPLQLDVGLLLGIPYLAFWFLARAGIRRLMTVRAAQSSTAAQ